MKEIFITITLFIAICISAQAQISNISVKDLAISGSTATDSIQPSSKAFLSMYADSLDTDTIPDILEILKTPTLNGDSVNLFSSEKIKVLFNSHRFQNRENSSQYGYRIQIASINSAEKEVKELEEMRDKFEETFPDIAAYLIYTVPDFKIRVGNYRNKLESIPDLHRIREIYPESYTVKSEITAKELQHQPLMIRLEQEAQAKARHIQDSIMMLHADSLGNVNTDIISGYTTDTSIEKQ